jgi:hypothetical protein
MSIVKLPSPSGRNAADMWVSTHTPIGRCLEQWSKESAAAYDSKVGLKRRPADKVKKPVLGYDKQALSILTHAVKMARDEEPDSGFVLQKDGPDMDAVRVFLQNRLRPEDWKRLCDMLSGQDPDADPAEDNELERETSERERREETRLATMSNDDPPDFPGMPRKGGTMVKKQAADRRYNPRASYDERFPGASVTVTPGGTAR